MQHPDQNPFARRRDAMTPRKDTADWLRALERSAKATASPDRIFGNVLDELAASHGDRPALIARDAMLSFAALAEATNRYARWALANGVTKGTCVALLMPNCPDYLAIWAGITRVGGIVALINANLQGQALAHCIDLADPKHVIIADSLRNAYDGSHSHRVTQTQCWWHGTADGLDKAVMAFDSTPLAPDETPAVCLSDRALYIYTSGTTGLPKAAHVSHRRIIEWSYWFAGLMNTQSDDRMYDCLPMYHSVGGIVAIGSVLVSGGSVVIREKFSASQFWDDVTQSGCTLFQYIGELCRYLLKAPPHPSETGHRLRICCGNGMRGDVWTAFQQRFGIPRVLEFYAATEGSFSLYNVEGKPGAIGRLPGYMTHRAPLALVQFDPSTGLPKRDAEGRCIRCADDEVGEALGRLHAGKNEGNRFEGYTTAADSEKKLLRDVFAPGDAWFRTGDLMRRDATGFYYFADRVGDTFRWKGENVATTEVENALAACPGVAQATVYGVVVPGEDGRAGMATLVTTPDFSLAVLQQQLSNALPVYARPVFLRLTHSLAITETFKQKKQHLIDDGYDPSRVDDALFVNEKGVYQPLTVERYARIAAGS